MVSRGKTPSPVPCRLWVEPRLRRNWSPAGLDNFYGFFDTAANRVDLTASGGIGNITIQKSSNDSGEHTY